MTLPPSPPRLSRAILQRALPADVREDVIGDLNEVFQRDVAQTGLSHARRCYRRKAISFGATFLIERVRDRWTSLLGARISLLDLRLGARMLARYPGLTLVGGMAMAMGIAIGLVVFTFVAAHLFPTIPLDEGDRIVTVRLMDADAGVAEHRVTLDVSRWREQLTTVQGLGAGRPVPQNLITSDGHAEPLTVMELSAAAFRIPRVAPQLGRGLVEADERPGAPAVLVLGHELWQQRFNADPAVINRVVTLGHTPATVVGVMPEGFLFPMAEQAWGALQTGPAPAPRTGPSVRVFGRLADGVTFAQAEAQAAAISAQAATDFPSTHERLHLEVLPLAEGLMEIPPDMRVAMLSFNVFFAMLLVLVSGNVALLMFARAATRDSEIIVRSALGASRARLVSQFFAEALVLGSVAAVLGLIVASSSLTWVFTTFEAGAGDGRLPFWFTPQLSTAAIVYTAALTLLAALVAGVMPALKVTRGLQSGLKASTAGGGGLKFGGVWTAIIVVQVAVTMAFPVTAFFTKRDGVQIESVEIGVPADRVLTARVQASGSAAAELLERLRNEPGVIDATMADRLPLMWHPLLDVDIEAGDSPLVDTNTDQRVSIAAVAPGFFAAFDAPVLSGRGFTHSDSSGDHHVLVVNQSFVTRKLGGRNPVGMRIRLVPGGQEGAEARAAAPWREVIGVVRDMGMGVPPDPGVAGLYLPLSQADSDTTWVAVRVAGDAMTLAPRLRATATATDPTMRVSEVRPLSHVTTAELRSIDFFFRVILGISAVALVLSLASIYAVMSFAVARRTREIGIRIALGSDRPRVVLAILRRPLLQVGIGLAAGTAFTALIVNEVYNRSLTPSHWGLIASYAALMLGVCLLACIVPTRRALRVEPTEALRTE
jgi:putative ABC transport system permease protein